MVVAIGLFASARSATLAQDAVQSMTTTSEPSYAAPEANTAPAPVPISSPADSNIRPGSEVSAEPRRFAYGLQITVRGIYDDNINISNASRLSDYYIAIEPVLTLGAGDIRGHQGNYIRLDYAPSVFVFTRHSENDAVQHVIHLEGYHEFARLTLMLGGDVAILDGTDLRNIGNQDSPGSIANIDLSRRARFETYNTKLSATYDLSGKTFLSTDFNSAITHYDSAIFLSSENLSENLFLNYRYSDKLILGLGGTGGYDVVGGPNPNQTFEQANARLSYQVTGKIALSLSGGLEFRQFEHNSRGQYISPVYALIASYQPFDGTTVALNGSRGTYNSGVLAGQDFSGTTIIGSFRQRFAQRFFVGLAAGYENNNYFSTISGLSTNRNDNYYFIEPGLDFSITRFWTIGAYYLYRRNDSSLQPFAFDDSQVGFRTGLVF
jgi:hypothetical protein